MTGRPVLYVMCGLPFAGKSTLARRLAVERDAVIVELDTVNTELGIGLGPERITPAEWERSYAESWRRIEALLRSGRSCIWDATNYTRAQRDRLRLLAGDVSADLVVVYVPISRPEAERRLVENRASGVRGDVRDDDFVQVANSFQEPEDDERVMLVTDAATIKL